MACAVCDNTGWVCENHHDRPWDGGSDRADACGCGAGDPCAACNPHAGIERIMLEIHCQIGDTPPAAAVH